jgi:hypothetical protein
MEKEGLSGAGVGLSVSGDGRDGVDLQVGTGDHGGADSKDGVVHAGEGNGLRKKRGVGPKKSQRVWCVCKTADEGSMIECEECNDW